MPRPTYMYINDSNVFILYTTVPSIYVYDTDFVRVPSLDISGLSTAGNSSPTGICVFDGVVYVADLVDAKIYAYDLVDGAHLAVEDFNTLYDAGNRSPTGIWSDGQIMNVVDTADNKIYAYNMATKVRSPGNDISFHSNHASALDLWSDGTTMWVLGSNSTVYAYNLATGVYTSNLNVVLSDSNTVPNGVIANRTTMWVSDPIGEKLYAYKLYQERPSSVRFRAVGFEDEDSSLWRTESGKIKEVSAPGKVSAPSIAEGQQPIMSTSITVGNSGINYGYGDFFSIVFGLIYSGDLQLPAYLFIDNLSYTVNGIYIDTSNRFYLGTSGYFHYPSDLGESILTLTSLDGQLLMSAVFADATFDDFGFGFYWQLDSNVLLDYEDSVVIFLYL